MNERRDYKSNGRGRRDYDKSFEAMCLHCNLREEVNTKVSWKHLLAIFGIIGAIVSAVLTFTIPPAVHGVERMRDTSKATLDAVYKVSERTARIETRQEIIMDRVKRPSKWSDNNSEFSIESVPVD